MKEKTNIEALTDIYKYYMRLKPEITETTHKIYDHPVGEITYRKQSRLVAALRERL